MTQKSALLGISQTMVWQHRDWLNNLLPLLAKVANQEATGANKRACIDNISKIQSLLSKEEYPDVLLSLGHICRAFARVIVSVRKRECPLADVLDGMADSLQELEEDWLLRRGGILLDVK